MGLQEHLITDVKLTPSLTGYKSITRIGQCKHLGIIVYIKNKWTRCVNEIETNINQNEIFGGPRI